MASRKGGSSGREKEEWKEEKKVRKWMNERKRKRWCLRCGDSVVHSNREARRRRRKGEQRKQKEGREIEVVRWR